MFGLLHLLAGLNTVIWLSGVMQYPKVNSSKRKEKKKLCLIDQQERLRVRCIELLCEILPDRR